VIVATLPLASIFFCSGVVAAFSVVSVQLAVAFEPN